jgi:hypothetical protein
MNIKKLLLVVTLGFIMAVASLFSSAIVIGVLLIYGGIVGLITIGSSGRLLRSLGHAIAWGCSVMLTASIFVFLAKLGGRYSTDLLWPIAPENAIGAIWGGGGLMMLLWLFMGGLIRRVK